MLPSSADIMRIERLIDSLCSLTGLSKDGAGTKRVM